MKGRPIISAACLDLAYAAFLALSMPISEYITLNAPTLFMHRWVSLRSSSGWSTYILMVLRESTPHDSPVPTANPAFGGSATGTSRLAENSLFLFITGRRCSVML